MSHLLVVLGTLLQKLPRRLHVVEVGVQVGKEDSDLATCAKKVGDLTARGRSTSADCDDIEGNGQERESRELTLDMGTK
jgi:hypothetical protein